MQLIAEKITKNKSGDPHIFLPPYLLKSLSYLLNRYYFQDQAAQRTKRVINLSGKYYSD